MRMTWPVQKSCTFNRKASMPVVLQISKTSVFGILTCHLMRAIHVEPVFSMPYRNVQFWQKYVPSECSHLLDFTFGRFYWLYFIVLSDCSVIAACMLINLHFTTYRRTRSPGRLAWSEGRRPPGTGAGLHSSDEPSELLQWLSHDDSTINIVICYYYYYMYYYYYYSHLWWT